VPYVDNPKQEEIADTLTQARAATEKILMSFLLTGEPAEFKNEIYRFDDE